MADALNKIIIRWEYMETLSGRCERELYFNTFIIPQYKSIIDYYIIRYKLTSDYELEDVKQSIYVRLVLLQNKYKKYKIKNITNYVYMVVQNEIIAFLEKRNNYRMHYINRTEFEIIYIYDNNY